MELEEKIVTLKRYTFAVMGGGMHFPLNDFFHFTTKFREDKL